MIRHGQASYGQAEYDRLSDQGRDQASRLGAALPGLGMTPVDAVYAGSLTRQRDTAAHLGAAAAAAGALLPAPIERADLDEYPAFELVAALLPVVLAARPELAGAGADRAQMDRAFWHVITGWSRDELRAPGLPTIGDFAARVSGAIRAILAAHPGPDRRLMVVTSGGVIGVVVALAMASTPAHGLALAQHLRNASVTELRFRGRASADATAGADLASLLTVVGVNHAAHLPPSLHTTR